MRRDPESLFKEAKLFEAAGDDARARDAYFAVLEADAQHFGALNNLGNLFARRGLTAAALVVYREAIKQHPDNPAGHVNLGATYLDADEIASARQGFERALQLDPMCAEAHQGLSAVLTRLGDDVAARRHRLAGFRDRAIVRVPFRGEGAPLADILVLLSAAGGNVDVRRVLDDRRFAVTKLFVDARETAMDVPQHDLIFNAIGDADLCGDALKAADALVRRTNGRVLNAPAAVLASTRTANARRLGKLPGVTAPRTERFTGDAPSGFRFPLLVRAPGYHAGAHLLQVSDAAQLRNAVAQLPAEELLAIEFLDARGADGKFRKYRVMIVGGNLYPLHLAISSGWMVHYFSADNAAEAAYRDEEACFLNDMPAVLGPNAVAALERIRDVLQLDYAGVDFGLDREGNVLLFEANATMTIPPEPSEEMWAYRRTAIHRTQDAVESMVALASTYER